MLIPASNLKRVAGRKLGCVCVCVHMERGLLLKFPLFLCPKVHRRSQELKSTIILESNIICCTLSMSGLPLLESTFRRQGYDPFSCVIVDEVGVLLRRWRARAAGIAIVQGPRGWGLTAAWESESRRVLGFVCAGQFSQVKS